MNYIFFRIIVLFLLLSLILVLNILRKKNKIVGLKSTFVLISIMLFFYGLLVVFPIEKNIMNLNSLEKSFHYFFPNSKIIRTYEYNDYAFIVSEQPNHDILCMNYLIKKNGIWEVNNLLTKNKGNKIMTMDGFITYYKLPDRGVLAIKLSYLTLNGKDEKVYDSLSSNIDMFYSNFDDSSFDNVAVIIIEGDDYQKLTKDYSIFYNNSEHKILDVKKGIIVY